MILDAVKQEIKQQTNLSDAKVEKLFNMTLLSLFEDGEFMDRANIIFETERV